MSNYINTHGTDKIHIERRSQSDGTTHLIVIIATDADGNKTEHTFYSDKRLELEAKEAY